MTFKSPTPTSAPIDWNLVGPKLVAESTALLTAVTYSAPTEMNGVLGYVALVPVEFVDDLLAALAATQPA